MHTFMSTYIIIIPYIIGGRSECKVFKKGYIIYSLFPVIVEWLNLTLITANSLVAPALAQRHTITSKKYNF